MTRPDDLHSFVVGEAMEGIAELESTLLRLEQTPDDHEAVSLAVRIVGDLKSRRAMMHGTEMTCFFQAIEDLLDQLRSGARPVTPLVVDALLASVDVLRRLVGQIGAEHETTGQPDENVERVRGLIASFVEQSRRVPIPVELDTRLPRSV
jgi:two-component system, chemotaxis family, sensor kinase CheA